MSDEEAIDALEDRVDELTDELTVERERTAEIEARLEEVRGLVYDAWRACQ